MIRKEHPSYATLNFNRLHNGKNTALFGSNIEHGDTIRMEIKHAVCTRDLNRDWIHSKNIIAIADMSYSQFAEAITSFGIDEGVPITLRYTEKDGRISEPDFESRTEIYEDEFKEHLSSFNEDGSKLVSDIKEIFSKNSVGKKDKESILSMIRKYIQNVTSNTDFIYKQFNESMQKTVKEAKAEVEAFTQNRLDSIAKSAIAKAIEEDDNILKLKPVDIQ